MVEGGEVELTTVGKSNVSWDKIYVGYTPQPDIIISVGGDMSKVIFVTDNILLGDTKYIGGGDIEIYLSNDYNESI